MTPGFIAWVAGDATAGIPDADVWIPWIGGIPTTTHECKFDKEYVGLQKVLKYCECGKERDADWTEVGEAKKGGTK